MKHQDHTISPLTRVRSGDSVDLVRLMAELGVADLPSDSPDYLMAVAACPTTTLLVARDGNGRIVGLTILGRIVAFSGTKFWLEDVVVSPDRQGEHIGEELVLRAIEMAIEEGASNVNLTTRPHRVAANKLYRKLGFQPVDTNYLRLSLKTNIERRRTAA